MMGGQGWQQGGRGGGGAGGGAEGGGEGGAEAGDEGGREGGAELGVLQHSSRVSSVAQRMSRWESGAGERARRLKGVGCCWLHHAAAISLCGGEPGAVRRQARRNFSTGYGCC